MLSAKQSKMLTEILSKPINTNWRQLPMFCMVHKQILQLSDEACERIFNDSEAMKNYYEYLHEISQ